MRWADRDGDYVWNLRILVWRVGPDDSPVDRYTMTGSGRGSAQIGYDRVKVDRRGARILVDTRRTRLGNLLRLYAPSFFDDPTDVEVSPVLVDPFGLGQSPGSRLVAVKAQIRNVGPRRASGSFSPRVILGDNTSAQRYTVDGCAADFDIPAGETRSVCSSFDLPAGAAVNQVEWGPGEEELGVWRP